MFVTRRLAIIVTLKCTLNCKLCCNCVPYYDETPILDKTGLMSDIDSAFELYDRIEWLQFVGGELFLHPNLDEILEKAFEYQDRFDKIIFMTNATILPRPALLEAMRRHKQSIEVQISDYGKLSSALTELTEQLAANEIPFVVKSFHGDMQHYGGWVDTGDFTHRGYTQPQLEEMFHACWQIGMGNLHTYKGRLHNCIRSLFVQDLGKADIPRDEYVDLHAADMTLAQKREIAARFNTCPLTACQYCNGFHSKNSKRYPAAEQVT